jgi:hypothetical protein
MGKNDYAVHLRPLRPPRNIKQLSADILNELFQVGPARAYEAGACRLNKGRVLL